MVRGNVEHMAEPRRVQVLNLFQDDQQVVLGVVVHHEFPVAVEEKAPDRVQDLLSDCVGVGQVCVATVYHLDEKEFQQEYNGH